VWLEALLAAIVFVALVGLLVVLSRRYGPPRLYMRPVVALWVIVAMFAALLIWLALD
jgi:hypothetical protein